MACQKTRYLACRFSFLPLFSENQSPSLILSSAAEHMWQSPLTPIFFCGSHRSSSHALTPTLSVSPQPPTLTRTMASPPRATSRMTTDPHLSFCSFSSTPLPQSHSQLRSRKATEVSLSSLTSSQRPSPSAFLHPSNPSILASNTSRRSLLTHQQSRPGKQVAHSHYTLQNTQRRKKPLLNEDKSR